MSGDSQKLLELAERVEKAEGPSVSLGRRISIAMGLTADEVDALIEDGEWCNPTASLDAALTLVPSGAGLTLNRYWIARGEAWSCLLCTGGVPSNPRREFTSEDAASGPAALTAAALRARAAL